MVTLLLIVVFVSAAVDDDLVLMPLGELGRRGAYGVVFYFGGLSGTEVAMALDLDNGGLSLLGQVGCGVVGSVALSVTVVSGVLVVAEVVHNYYLSVGLGFCHIIIIVSPILCSAHSFTPINNAQYHLSPSLLYTMFRILNIPTCIYVFLPYIISPDVYL